MSKRDKIIEAINMTRQTLEVPVGIGYFYYFNDPKVTADAILKALEEPEEVEWEKGFQSFIEAKKLGTLDMSLLKDFFRNELKKMKYEVLSQKVETKIPNGDITLEDYYNHVDKVIKKRGV